MTLSFTFLSYADEITMTGVVVNITTSLNVRSTPVSPSETNKLGILHNGDNVSIFSSVTVENTKWYKIAYSSPKGSVGYVCADYVSAEKIIAPDESSSSASDVDYADYQEYLKAQGFSESYWPALQQLHMEYPNWVIKAKQTGLDWNTAISNESIVGTNTVQDKYTSDAWQSYEKGAYDWTNGSFVSFDTGGWVTASSDLTSYYIDPRNFLNSTYLFQFQSLAYSDSETVSGIQSILNGTFMDNSHTYSDSQFATYADAFLSAAKDANVSAYMLAARAKQEQGFDGNSIGTGTTEGYEGYYNLFDINAAAGGGNSAVLNGAIYAKAKGWDTTYKSILGSATFLGTNYNSKGQDTLYFQKFNVVNSTSGFYNHQYMTNVMAPSGEGKSLSSAYTPECLTTQSLVFSIPVYNNMPSTAVSKPISSGNNNNLLSSLSMSGGALSPATFDRYTYSYEAIVSSNVSSVTVNATASDSGATVSGAGNVGLNYGNNNINVIAIATNGSSRTYTLSIYRQAPVYNNVYAKYSTHVEYYGWQSYVSDGALSGTTGEAKRLEGIKISVENCENLGIRYSTHVQDIGWQGYVSDGEMSGTTGQSKRLEAIKIELTGSDAELYDIYYCVHAENYGWLDWAKNGSAAGTEGLSLRLEAIKIKIVKKTDNVSLNTNKPFISVYGDGLINYRSHVENIGWQKYVCDGNFSGTTGKCLRLEAINIKLSNQMSSGSVTYSTHVQDIGWMNAVSDGALSGTSGQAKRLEAIRISLNGEIANQYDVYYRVHAQDIGWMGWAKNGESAGTAGLSSRLECIQIVLVGKGGAAPGSTANVFIQK